MYLFEKDEDSIVNWALLVSLNLHCNGNTSLYGKISEIFKSHGLPHFVPNNLDKTKISWYKDIMKQKHITRLTVFSYWFKHCYEISSYLNPTSKTIDRKALVTFGKTTRKKS